MPSERARSAGPFRRLRFEVEAAGGVVIDERPSGIRILLVHRPAYDDWSLPKGKLEPGETARDAALREVREETGYKCKLLEKLPEVQYVDQLGRRKRVRYWIMHPIKGSFKVNDEVDRIKWARPLKARQMLSYRRDANVVKNALRLLDIEA